MIATIRRVKILAAIHGWDEAAEKLRDATRAVVAAAGGEDDLALAIMLDELHDSLRAVAGLPPRRKPMEGGR